jgi:hypothetical protein
MKHEHRVAIMVTSQVIMDIEAENDIESIRKEAIRSYSSGEGNQETGFAVPQSVVLYPMLEEGQEPPKGSLYPAPTEMQIDPEDFASIDITKIMFPSK